MWFYNFGLILSVWAIRLVAPRHPKARVWIEGRKDLFRRMREAIAPTDRIIWIHVASLGEFEQGRPIIEQLRKTHPDYNIVYIKGDQFTNELIEAVKKGQNVEFRNKYRGADLFLVDDIQFIAGKESTQEEFFHTFNSLYSANKQIIISSDKPPKDMEILDERFRS